MMAHSVFGILWLLQPFIPVASHAETCKDAGNYLKFGKSSGRFADVGAWNWNTDSVEIYDGHYLVERSGQNETLWGRKTFQSVDMFMSGRSTHSSAPGRFVYYCELAGQWYIAENSILDIKCKLGCAGTWHQMQTEHLGEMQQCRGWAHSTTHSVESAWVVESDLLLSLPAFLQVVVAQTPKFVQELGYHWEAADFAVSQSSEHCMVNKFHPWMNLTPSIKPFCLAGWGEQAAQHLCKEGHVQHPMPLTCKDGNLNLDPLPAALQFSGESKGWWCAPNVDLASLLHFDALPPFYFIFSTVVLKMLFCIFAFGPPRPGKDQEIASLVDRMTLFAKTCVQAATLALAVVTFASDMVKAVTTGAGRGAGQGKNFERK